MKIYPFLPSHSGVTSVLNSLEFWSFFFFFKILAYVIFFIETIDIWYSCEILGTNKENFYEYHFFNIPSGVIFLTQYSLDAWWNH